MTIENETEIKTVSVKLICELNDCKGEMTPTGMIYDANPAQYQHKCNLCQHEENYSTKYPFLRYKIKD